MRLTALALAVLVPFVGSGQVRTIRYWFAYGDEATAQRARASGVDPNAQAGREISGARLAVPTNGKGFKVQLMCDLNDPGGLSRFSSGPSINLAFDRTFCGGFNQNPPLNSNSFRKVRPAGANQNNYLEAFTNGAIVPAWNNANSPSDEDRNGVQDIAQVAYGQSNPSAWRQGTQGEGESLRPVGLASYLSGRLLTPPQFAGALTGFKIPHATPFRLIDVNWVSMLTLGETYGSRPGETGLAITTSAQVGLANTTAFISSAEHSGARYTLVAVAPEPNSVSALALGALLLRRRRS